jgi:hypothetical protein
MQVWSECVSRASQFSEHLTLADPVADFNRDGAGLHVHQHAVLGVTVIDDYAIAGRGINGVG